MLLPPPQKKKINYGTNCEIYMHEEVRSSVLNKVGKYSEPNYNFINSRILIKNKLILIKTKQNKKSMLLNNINNNRITY